MDPVVVPFVGAVGVAVGTFLVQNARDIRRCRDAWLEAVRVCGLREPTMFRLFTFVGTARAGPFAVRVEPTMTRQARHALAVQLEKVTDRIGLLRPETAAYASEVVTSNEDILVGDPQLDDRLIVSGEPLAVHALLDDGTRAVLLRLIQRPRVRTLTLTGGTLRLAAEVSGFAETLGLVLELAERLAEVPPVEDRVAQIAGGDLRPAVRLTCLHALMEERPRHAATRGALRAALTDPHPDVRLSAALTLRTEGREALLGLARDPDMRDEIASRAIVALGAHFPPEDAERTLEAARRSGRYETVGACLDALAARGEAHLGSVRRLLEGPSDTVAALAASALGLSGSASAEPVLLEALAHTSADVRAAAVRSLGRVGTAESVPVLRAFEPSGDAAFRRAAREAVVSIQARLVGAGQGQLALAQDGGALSLADGAAGRVTLKDHRP